MFDCAKKIVTQEGPMALYNGFIPNWIRLACFVTTSMMVWEQLRKLFGVKAI